MLKIGNIVVEEPKCGNPLVNVRVRLNHVYSKFYKEYFKSPASFNYRNNRYLNKLTSPEMMESLIYLFTLLDGSPFIPIYRSEAPKIDTNEGLLAEHLYEFHWLVFKKGKAYISDSKSNKCGDSYGYYEVNKPTRKYNPERNKDSESLMLPLRNKRRYRRYAFKRIFKQD